MTAFKYRLQPLLDQKNDRKTQLQLNVALRQKELAAEEQELEELQRVESELERKLIESRRQMLTGGAGSTGLAIQQYRQYLSGLAIDLETARNSSFSQQLRVQEFVEKVAQAKRELTECLREIDVLAKHREKLEQRHVRAAEAKEAVEQDEIGATLFLQREAKA